MFSKTFFTLCGLLSVLLWCTNVYFIRLVSENIGYLASVGLIFLFSGILGLTIFLIQHKCKMSKITKKYVIICVIFVINNMSSSLTTVTAPDGDVLLQVTIISYLWVILLNIFLVTFLNYQMTKPTIFYIGNILAVLGIIISCIGFNFNQINFIKYFPKYYYCYIFALMSAFTWSYYSIYLKKWGVGICEDHIYISMIISGTTMTLLSFSNDKFNNFDTMSTNFKNIGLLLYEIIIATCLPYYLWNIGYKFGNVKIISNFTLFVPLINIFTTSLFYNYNLFNESMFSAIILIIAIMCCKFSIKESETYEGLDESLTNENIDRYIHNQQKDYFMADRNGDFDIL